MSQESKVEIFGIDTFVADFEKEHFKLNNLLSSFKKAVEASNLKRGREILCQIAQITEGHFAFEETYLYPRLRRLVSEITVNLENGQETMREFVSKSRNFLEDNKTSKDEQLSLLNILPRLSEFLNQCNDLLPLAKRFNTDDRADLDKRFKECCRKPQAKKEAKDG